MVGEISSESCGSVYDPSRGDCQRYEQDGARGYRKEDKDYWRAIPHVPGFDRRPMPRKAIKSKEESDDKFWDFMKQFLFGLWGFRQRPYPPGRPIDVAQAIGYKRLEKRYYDFIMKTGGWWYKDRLGRSRGPCELITLKTAYGAGIIDRDTFIWGEDMDEWAPIHMVYGLEPAIATWEVRLGAAATAFLHKLQKGIPPWVPLKGREPKTYKQLQLQKEAIESKKRDMAVLEANDGVWPGVRTPSHALDKFLNIKVIYYNQHVFHCTNANGHFNCRNNGCLQVEQLGAFLQCF